MSKKDKTEEIVELFEETTELLVEIFAKKPINQKEEQ